MQASEQSRFNSLYAKHVAALKRHGKAGKTIDSYARALRRVARVLDRCPDDLSVEELEQYFTDLIDSHSWSMVKIDGNGASSRGGVCSMLAIWRRCFGRSC